jgi:hypothetical protein
MSKHQRVYRNENGGKGLSDPTETEGKGNTISRAEHYKLVVEDSRAITEERTRINQWFVSLLTLILGAQGYLLIHFRAAISQPRSTLLAWD